MTPLLQDLRYAARSFVRSPGFSAVAVATLALGIGANTAIFALVDRALLRRLPVRDPKELFLLRSPGFTHGRIWSDSDDATSFTYPMYRDLRDRNTVFTGLLAQFPIATNVSARGETERASGELVSGNYFETLGVPPAIGRILTVDDDRAPGAHPVTVLSHAYWIRRFGGDPAILNKTITVNGQTLTIVGVAREGFAGIEAGRPADLFLPMMMKARMTPSWNGLDDPHDYWVQLVGRLKPGLSRARAEAGLQTVYRPLLQSVVSRIPGRDAAQRRKLGQKEILLVSGSRGRAVLRSGLATPLISLSGMVGLVLLIACSNLAGLLAARGAARQREYGIRLAIGASRAQLLRQSIVECLAFGLAGGGLGMLVADWTLKALLEAFPPDASLRQLAAQVDFRVLSFAAGVSLLTGLSFGIAPALRAARLDPSRTLAGSGRGSRSAGREALRFRGWLVTGQVALTLVLLVAGGFFARSLQNLGRVDLGLRPDHVTSFSITPELNGYPAARTALLARRLTESLSAAPGVLSVSAAELAILTGDVDDASITVEGDRPVVDEPRRVRRNWVGPDYFATLGIPLLSGREISWGDEAGAPKVAVINQTMARRFFPGRNPIGARFAYGWGKDVRPDIEIIGVVRDSKAAVVDEGEEPFVYQPYLQDSRLGGLTFWLRSGQDPGDMASAIREQVRRLDPQIPVYRVKTLRAQIAESLLTERMLVLLSAAFGVLAALLAALGIYGVLSYSVAQRRQEIGVRIALGADSAAVRRLVFADVGRFLLAGAAIGVPAAFALGRFVESILYGVHAADPRIFAAGLLLLAAVSLGAAWPPARRAARTNPLEALRGQ